MTNANDGSVDEQIDAKLKEFTQKYIDAMDDDLNTADAIAAIFDIVYMAKTNIDQNSSKETILAVLDAIRELGAVLGLFSKQEEKSLDAEIEALIEERTKARAEKNWAKADEIRDKLTAMNIVLKDTPQGVKWSYAK